MIFLPFCLCIRFFRKQRFVEEAANAPCTIVTPIDELSRSLLQRERRVRKREILVNSELLSDAPAMGHILVSE